MSTAKYAFSVITLSPPLVGAGDDYQDTDCPLMVPFAGVVVKSPAGNWVRPGREGAFLWVILENMAIYNEQKAIVDRIE